MPEVEQTLLERNFQEKDLQALAKEIRATILPQSLILLSGDLAAGKTTLVSYFCGEWGLKFVQSPTYAIHQRYENDLVKIDHFDLYRLETEDQLQSSGFYDLVNEGADYKLIEWPERIKIEDLPMNQPVYRIDLQRIGESERKIVLKLLRS